MEAIIPPAPQLSGAAMLEIFVHRSIPAPTHEPFGNGARLRLLGKPMLKMAYMDTLKDKRPGLQGEQFKVRLLWFDVRCQADCPLLCAVAIRRY